MVLVAVVVVVVVKTGFETLISITRGTCTFSVANVTVALSSGALDSELTRGNASLGPRPTFDDPSRRR